MQQDHFSQIEDKLNFLREALDQVETQIKIRSNHTQAFIQELQKKACEVRSDLHRLPDQSPANPNRRPLEQQIADLEREIRQQKIDCWRDIAGLQREKRQLEKEYRAIRGALCTVRKS